MFLIYSRKYFCNITSRHQAELALNLRNLLYIVKNITSWRDKPFCTTFYIVRAFTLCYYFFIIISGTSDLLYSSYNQIRVCVSVRVCVCVFTACLQTVTEWECFHYISEIQWIFFTSATGRHDRINKTCFHLIALQEKHSFVSSYNSQDNLDNLQFSTQYNGIDSDFRRNKFLLRLHIPKKCQTVFV